MLKEYILKDNQNTNWNKDGIGVYSWVSFAILASKICTILPSGKGKTNNSPKSKIVTSKSMFDEKKIMPWSIVENSTSCSLANPALNKWFDNVKKFPIYFKIINTIPPTFCTTEINKYLVAGFYHSSGQIKFPNNTDLVAQW